MHISLILEAGPFHSEIMARRFDESALLRDLQIWWAEEVGERDPFATPKPTTTGLEQSIEVDSLAMVSVLMVLEKHLPCQMPSSAIRPGGYLGFDDMAQDLLPKVKALLRKHAWQNRQGLKGHKEVV